MAAQRAKPAPPKSKVVACSRRGSLPTAGSSSLAAKSLTAEQALSCLRNGMRVFVGSGCAAPQSLVAALAARGQQIFDVEIVHILTFGTAPYTARESLDHFRHNAFFIGPNVRNAVNDSLADYTP